nr:hypothetical protein [Candidatus Sigynarchaeum springense]
MLTCTFLFAVVYGLFIIADLGKDRNKLSISKFDKMLNQILIRLTYSQTHKTPLKDAVEELETSGKTYYEFQRGNRRIGEFLFNVAVFFIVMCIAVGIFVWVAKMVNLFPGFAGWQLDLISVLFTLLGVMSFGIFLGPQWRVHTFLKDFKYRLVDKLSSVLARLEYLYYEAVVSPEIMAKIDESWKSRDPSTTLM